MTTRSVGSRSAIKGRARCRSLLATRCRSTDPPMALVTTKPISGPCKLPTPRWACTTRSGCAARTPRLTVVPKSADRVIRYRAGSTLGDRWVRQSGSDGPCADDPRRSPGRRECACAGGNHAPWPADGCSAGRSACPWPRLCLLVVRRPRSEDDSSDNVVAGTQFRTNRRGPGGPGRCRIATCGRLFEGTDHTCAGQTALVRLPIPAPPASIVHRLAPDSKPVSFWLSNESGANCPSRGP